MSSVLGRVVGGGDDGRAQDARGAFGASVCCGRRDTDTRPGVAHDDPVPARSGRPQWHGERDAVLVRMPMFLPEHLRAEAARRRISLTDAAAELIRRSLIRTGK